VPKKNSVPPSTKGIDLDKSDTIHQIFDKILKRILLSLSSGSIIAFINGLFSEDFPLDSKITYNYTENVNDRLKKTVADIIITLCTKDRVRRFHLEGQINDDNTIVIRIFEYGFADALRHQTTQGNKITLPFPTPAIIFLEHTAATPSEVILELDFGESGTFNYPVKAMKFLAHSVEELHEKNMTILLPLYLLKLRREIEKAKSRKRQREATLRQLAKKLKILIDESILPVVIESEKVGKITHRDAFELIKLLSRLYDYLYDDIEEFEIEEVKVMLADTLVLEYDVELAEVEARHEERLKEEKRIAALKLRDEKRNAALKLKEEKRNAAQKLKERQENTARKMKDDGITFEKIAEYTGLTLKELEKLQPV